MFGTEEIAGVPVIAMELMPGGTLEETVREHGPMTVTAAVDAILQIIDGLSAAHAVGILHRDIKPSNCFVDADGTVKIGDYGLSISYKGHERAITHDGETFMGTPAFASPEQLRGDDLTVRSDVYSVGVTLYYVLTGRAPYEARDQIRLLARVLESPPPDPRQLRACIPRRLAEAVLRCLAKCPDERFGGYQELRAELTRFATRGKRPAEPWQRLAAGAVDFSIIGLPVLAACRMLPRAEFSGLAAYLFYFGLLFSLGFTVMVLWIAYFTLLEWKSGRTPGKALLDLDVRAKESGKVAWSHLLRMLGRACLFVVLPVMLAFWVVPPLRITEAETAPVTGTFFGHRLEGTSISYRYESAIGLPTLAVWSVGMFLLFAAARRRNGWIALHDWLTDTCVVTNAAPEKRSAVITVDQNTQVVDAAKLGPFHILDSMAGTEDWFVGYDPNLLRKVWLRKSPPGTPPVAAALRNLRRAGRLRWLAGVRSAEENWDAYEFPGGRALLGLADRRVSWCELRLWMSDLAAEMSAAAMDGTRFDAPHLEQVWIAGDGRAKLLDFAAPGIAQPQVPASRSFWVELVERMLDHRPLPLPVRRFLQQLPNLDAPAMMMRELEFLAAVPVAVSRSRRCAIIATGGAGPVLFGLALFWMKYMSLAAAGFWALGSLIAFVAMPAMIAAVVAGDGLIMRATGVSVVDRYGRPADRALASRRSLIAWLPTLASPAIYASIYVWKGPDGAGIGTLAALGLIAGLSALLPHRSLHDRLAGTWLVPR